MAVEDSRRKLKKRKNEKKNVEIKSKLESSQSLQTEDNFYQGNKTKKNKKKFSVDKDDTKAVEQLNLKDESDAPGGGKKKSMKLRSGKKKNDKIARVEANEVGTPCDNESPDETFDSLKEAGERKVQKSMKKKRKSFKTQVDKLDSGEGQDEFADQNVALNEAEEHKMQKKMKKKRKNRKAHDVSEVDRHYNDKEDGAELKSDEEMVGEASTELEDHTASFRGLDEAEGSRIASSRNSKKARKVKKKSQLSINQSSQENSLEKKGEAAQDEVYEMSSGDEDSSTGMKKWVMEYYQSRPGLKVLQERIDDFIAAHEAQEEQARREREAKAAEGGWTVVVHHKGRKKTADAEGGTVVGSVAQAAVLDKMAKKKNKDAGPDFYRFQKREAHRNEIMMLQSKFEQDKKRIQQMRAERKFRPY